MPQLLMKIQNLYHSQLEVFYYIISHTLSLSESLRHIELFLICAHANFIHPWTGLALIVFGIDCSSISSLPVHLLLIIQALGVQI